MFAPPDPLESHRGEKGGAGRLVALVLLRTLEAGSFQRLLLGVAGEQAETDRHAVVERDPGEPVGRRGGDVLEVRGATADDHAERDHGVEALTGQRRGDDGELERTGHSYDDRRLHLVALER